MCCKCMVLLSMFRHVRLSLLGQNRFLIFHVILILMFGLLYRYLSLSDVWGLSSREVSELSSLHSSLYYSLITEFTVGALNNPESYWLRSCVMLQIFVSFVFLNL